MAEREEGETQRQRGPERCSHADVGRERPTDRGPSSNEDTPNDKASLVTRVCQADTRQWRHLYSHDNDGSRSKLHHTSQDADHHASSLIILPLATTCLYKLTIHVQTLISLSLSGFRYVTLTSALLSPPLSDSLPSYLSLQCCAIMIDRDRSSKDRRLDRSKGFMR